MDFGALMQEFVNKDYDELLAEIKQTAARWPNNRVFNVLGIIREYDAKCKGIGTGGLNDGELLREMILKILV